MVAILTGLSVAELTDGELKEAPIAHLGGKSPRQLMQTLGTEWGRNMVDQDVWLNVVAEKMRKARRDGFTGIVIPDVRFDNEARFVAERGGIVVRIERDGIDAVSGHVSEQGIDENLVYSVVQNNSTLRSLATAASQLASN